MRTTHLQANAVHREADRTSGYRVQVAYARLKAFILTCRVLPGDRLLHRTLAEELGMSSTPIREAMGRLVQEGYLHHVPNVGYSVRELDAEEAEQLYEAREALETHAAALAAARMHPEDLPLVEQAALSFRQAISRRPRKARALLDMQFHLTVARLSRNRFLLQALEPILHQIAAKRNVENIPAQAGGLQADRAHHRILTALRRREPELAREAMREHIQESKLFIVRQLKEVRLAARARSAWRRLPRSGQPGARGEPPRRSPEAA